MTAHANTLSCQWATPFNSPILLIQPIFISSNRQPTAFWDTLFGSFKTRSYFKQAALTLGLMVIPVSQTTVNINALYTNTAFSGIWIDSIGLIPNNLISNYVQPLFLNSFENKKNINNTKDNTVNMGSLNTVLTRFNSPVVINSVVNKKPIIQHNSTQGLQVLQNLKLSKENIRLAQFFAKKYYVASSDIEQYIHYAEQMAHTRQLESSLILAVMSIESNMNPLAQSSMGAQGLMQVMTSVHRDKYALLGGVQRAFDPQANITVGSMILAKYIKMGGSVKSGLKYYVGATGPSDGGYAAKVLAEKNRIEKARLGTFDFTANKLPLNYSIVNTNNSSNATLSTVNTTNTTLTKKYIPPNNNYYLATPTISPLNRSTIPAAQLSSVSLLMPSATNIKNTNTNTNTNNNINYINTSNTSNINNINNTVDINHLQSPLTEAHQSSNVAATSTIDTASGTTND